MTDEYKVFRAALIVSVGAHALFLFFNPEIFVFDSKTSRFRAGKAEVRYLEKVQSIKLPKVTQDSLMPLVKMPIKVTAEKTVLPPQINRSEIFRQDRQLIAQRTDMSKLDVLKPDGLNIKKKITLTPGSFDKSLSASPAYAAHSAVVRNQLRQKLYESYGFELGQATLVLSFVLSRDGYVKDIRIVKEQSSTSPYFNELTLKCVRDAAPYAPFPKGLDYDNLTYNVVITFEAE